jgi:hypothetical protein
VIHQDTNTHGSSAPQTEIEAPTAAAIAIRDPIVSLASFVRELGVTYVTIQVGFDCAALACDRRDDVRALYATLVKHGATPKAQLSETYNGARSWLRGSVRIGDLDINVYGGLEDAEEPEWRPADASEAAS